MIIFYLDNSKKKNINKKFGFSKAGMKKIKKKIV